MILRVGCWRFRYNAERKTWQEHRLYEAADLGWIFDTETRYQWSDLSYDDMDFLDRFTLLRPAGPQAVAGDGSQLLRAAIRLGVV